MENKIKELKERFRKATKSDLAQIDAEMETLASEDGDAFASAMIQSAKESIKEADELAVREKLAEVLPIVSVSYLAKNYFKKTPQWFYHRLNGNIVNGKKAVFSASELEKLAGALDEIANKLKKSASLI